MTRPRAPQTFADVIASLASASFGLWLFAATAMIATRSFDLTFFFMAIGTGTAMYVVLAIAGAGLLWSRRRARSEGLRPSRLTSALSVIVLALLIAPWLGLFILSIVRGQ